MAKDTSTLGSRLRQARQARGLSVREVATLLGRDKGAVYRYEWDQHEPSLADIARLARLYRVTVALLVDPKHAKGRLPEVRSNPLARTPSEPLLPEDERERDAAA